jgi:hypothetical protein
MLLLGSLTRPHPERPYTVGTHVAEGHGRPGLGSWSCAHAGEDTVAGFGESCRHR